MALTRGEVQVTWPTAANSISVTAGATQQSEAVALDTTTVQAAITLKADNAGTPASGDVIDFYWASSAGDPDGASTSEYPADIANMGYLGRIDTYSDTDADKLTVTLPPVPQNGYVYAVSGASSNSITVSATIEELKAA